MVRLVGKEKKEQDDGEVSATMEKLFDVRLRDKLLGEGKLNMAQLEAYNASLPDDTENMQVMELASGHDAKVSLNH
jgi:hypothetical protein